METESHFIDELCHKLATTDAPRLDSGSKEAAINEHYLNDATTLINQLTDAITTTLTANYMYGGKDNEPQYRASDLANIRAILNDVKKSLRCLDRMQKVRAIGNKANDACSDCGLPLLGRSRCSNCKS